MLEKRAHPTMQQNTMSDNVLIRCTFPWLLCSASSVSGRLLNSICISNGLSTPQQPINIFSFPVKRACNKLAGLNSEVQEL